MKNKKKDNKNVKHTKLYAKAVSGQYEYNNMDNVVLSGHTEQCRVLAQPCHAKRHFS